MKRMYCWVENKQTLIYREAVLANTGIKFDTILFITKISRNDFSVRPDLGIVLEERQ